MALAFKQKHMKGISTEFNNRWEEQSPNVTVNYQKED